MNAALDSDTSRNMDDEEETIDETQMEASPTSKSPKPKRARLTFPFGACRVCSDSATGIHYGIATCEGCKGFFKRSILRKEKYRCYFDKTCVVNVANRNRCKACRFRRCIDEGMSVDGVKMGRIPKLVKEKALKELKEQKMREQAALAETKEIQARDSSSSDRSVENYDPNATQRDSIATRVSSIQQQDNSRNSRTNDSSENKTTSQSSTVTLDLPQSQSSIENSSEPVLNSQRQKCTEIIYKTKHSTFLPDDFTVDETDGVPEQATGLLSGASLKHAQTIANKLSSHSSDLTVELNNDEAHLVRYLRSMAYDIFRRRSNRLQQLIYRMNKMIEQNIQVFPGDNATMAEFLKSIQLSCSVYTRATIVYFEEMPGMKNISLETLRKIISCRSFDWYLLKYHQLYNDNGQCYFLAPNGFHITRYWMVQLHGLELTEAVFDFCKIFRQLNLTEREFSLVIALHMFTDEATNEDREIVQILRSCYLCTLYRELCHNRGDIDGRRMCSKILQTLKIFIPLNELYLREAALRALEVQN